MAYQIHRETLVGGSDERVVENSRGRADYYALAWDDERPEDGSLRLDLDSRGRIAVRIQEHCQEGPEDDVTLPLDDLQEAIAALKVAVKFLATEDRPLPRVPIPAAHPVAAD